MNGPLCGFAWPEPVVITGAAAAASGGVEIPPGLLGYVSRAPWPSVDRFLADRAPGAAALMTALGRLIEQQGEGGLPAPADRAIVVGTWSAAINEVHEFMTEVEAVGANLVNPGLFPFTVINAAAGLAAIQHCCQGPNLTLNNGPTSALDALAHAADLVVSERCRTAFAGGFESVKERFSRVFGASRGPFAIATVLALVTPRTGRLVPGRPAARLLAYCSGQDDGRGPEALRRDILEAATGLAREVAPGSSDCAVLPMGDCSAPETLLIVLLDAVRQAEEGESGCPLVVLVAPPGQPRTAALVLDHFASPSQ